MNTNLRAKPELLDTRSDFIYRCNPQQLKVGARFVAQTPPMVFFIFNFMFSSGIHLFWVAKEASSIHLFWAAKEVG